MEYQCQRMLRSRNLAAVLAIVGAALMEMELPAQDGGWPADAGGTPYPLFQHCLPPATVLGKPVRARFTASLLGAGVTVTFERDAKGNTRTELGHGLDGAPQVVMLWTPEDRTLRLVDYHRASISTLKGPASGRSDSWSFTGLDAEWTDIHREIVGHDSRKVVLKPRKEGPIRFSGECWVSESLVLVMQERVEGPEGRVTEWKITEVEEKAPDRDILAFPPGFKDK
jgi:hypothetical protein